MLVSVCEAGSRSYPKEPPFDPPEHYPELPSAAWHLDPTNAVYPAVRESLRLLGLDADRYGTPDWNPLGEIIEPGQRVLIKPNIVRHFHGDGRGLDALVTHGSVVRGVLDYVILALKGRGSVIVGDSPLQYADFARTVTESGLARVVEEVIGYGGVPIEVIDFRKERSEKRGEMIVSRIPNNGDPRGYQVVDLGPKSRFSSVNAFTARRFRVTQYDPMAMRHAHNGVNHSYLFPKTVLRADVVINLPKLKTHRKAGITAAMKNLVGINGSKDWLPHHTAGPRVSGGDEYLKKSYRKAAISMLRDAIEARKSNVARGLLRFLERSVKATGKVIPFPDPFWEGSWHGNDTLWRMVHDLHKILFYADASGRIYDAPVRKYLALVDAVIAGEGEGPMRPSPRNAGLIIGGANPVAVDIVCSRLMGFDPRKIPLLSNAIGNGTHPGVPAAELIRVASNRPRWERLLKTGEGESLHFVPPAGWAGVIERDT